MTTYEQPTMELRFIERDMREGGSYTPNMHRVLQQKWIVDDGVRTIAFQCPSPTAICLERKPDGDGLWAICREEWRDVPMEVKE